jgi:hypothetical protein
MLIGEFAWSIWTKRKEAVFTGKSVVLQWLLTFTFAVEDVAIGKA